MGIWISILLWALGQLISWLLSRKKSGIPLTPTEIGKVNHAIYLARQAEREAVTMGCIEGGKLPDMPVSDPNAPAVVKQPRDWLGITQTVLLAGIMVCVVPTKFQGCHFPNPFPPGPPPAPVPSDPLTESLQAAYAADTDPQKAAHKGLLQALYASAATTTVYDPAISATDALLAKMQDARKRLPVADTELVSVRGAIRTYLDAAVGTAVVNLDQPTRDKISTAFKAVAKALGEVK